jgi:hypothetical protein
LAQALTIFFLPGRVLLRGTLQGIFALPSGILFPPGVVVTATIQPATHHPQITGAIVHRVAVLVVDVFAIALSDFARGHRFSPGRVSVSTRLFCFCRALVFFVLHLVIASKGHPPIVICPAFCKEGAKLKKIIFNITAT